ncbi:hypothetical protein [Kitasatospora sp. NPDC050543]|uniref:hypothetical protein n=1 Tax=Kitasatospora sp. NPDC050543 TaxID=3364054 RepID=UPI0037A9D513
MRAFRAVLAGLLTAFAAYYLLTVPNQPAPEPETAPSEAPLRLVHWQFQGRFCADGWGGDSVHAQGNCVGHGGALTKWQDSAGVVITCTAAPPLSELKRSEATDARGRVVC